MMSDPLTDIKQSIQKAKRDIGYYPPFDSIAMQDYLTREERLRREGRTKILPIFEECVLTHFLNSVMGQPYPNYSPALADSKQVPADVVIGRVHHNVFNRQFEFQVFHETFDPVPEGMEIPRMCPMMKVQYDPQSGGRVSVLWGDIEANTAEFIKAADIESNTPITAGIRSLDRAKLKSVDFKEVPINDPFYIKTGDDTLSFRKTGLRHYCDLTGSVCCFDTDGNFEVLVEANTPITVGAGKIIEYKMGNGSSLLMHGAQPEENRIRSCDTPITVGGSPDRFSLRMVEFGELRMGDEYFNAYTGIDGKKHLSRFIKVGDYETCYSKGATGTTFTTIDSKTMVFINPDKLDDPAMPFYCDNGQLKSRYDETTSSPSSAANVGC
jgi:hypothetical protein